MTKTRAHTIVGRKKHSDIAESAKGKGTANGGREGYKLTEAQRLLRIHLIELGIATTPEYRFCDRLWRFDLASERHRLAFECNGHYRGRHGAGWSNDAAKLNEAQMLGWRVLVFTNHEVLTGKAKEWLEGWITPKPCQ